MKKQITTIILGILMLAGAMAMYSGESITFETNLTSPAYTVVGNTSSLDGLNITFGDSNITISAALNYKPDNFTLLFFNKETREIVKTIHTRSRSTKIKYVDNNVTIYVPKYINTTEYINITKEIVVDKVIEEEITSNNKIKIWYILLPLFLVTLVICIIVKKKFPTKKRYKMISKFDEYI